MLTGCGSSDHDMSSAPTAGAASSSAAAAGTPASSSGNEADVAFATGMIPHHAQAIQMADLAAQRATNAEVKKLATAIKAAQAPEIRQLSGWLTGWGKPVPATDGSMAMDHAAGGHSDMVGMMTEEEMKQLSAANGAAFDVMWLQMMIKHHEGAVTMAQGLLATGSNADAKELAQTIIATQKAEIVTMQGLLSSLT